MTWQTIAQNIADQVTGVTGITLCTIAIGIAGIHAALHSHWNRFWGALGGVAVLQTAGWIVNTIL